MDEEKWDAGESFGGVVHRDGEGLDFIDSDKLSMTVILTAMNRFINETDGSKTAFLDGNQPDRLCKPMKDYIEGNNENGTKGEVIAGMPLRRL